MLNKIQKLIEEAEVQKKIYKESSIDAADPYQNGYYDGLADGRDFLIRELTLLLKHDESNQPQPPISQTQMLGEVPQEGHFNISESSQAVEGETRLVGQNEQTKELCQCVGVVHVSDVNGTWYCLSCKLPVN